MFIYLETDSLKITTSFLSIIVAVLAIIFFGAISLIIYNYSITNSSGTTIAEWVLISFFLAFAILGFYLIINFRVITLDRSALIIKKPILFISKVIPIKNISKIRLEDQYRLSKYNWKKIKIHGRQKTVIYYNDKQIEFNSFETTNFIEFNKLLHKITSKKKSVRRN